MHARMHAFIFASTNFFHSRAGGDPAPAAAKRQEHLNVTAARQKKDNMPSQQQVPISSKFAGLFLQHCNVHFESYYYMQYGTFSNWN